jgi:chorismate mutase
MPLRGIRTLLLCGLLALASCERTPVPAEVAASEPEASVRELAKHLRDNDLEGFARAAVPPTEYVRLEAAWREGRSRWPLTELPLDDQLEPLLAVLSAPGSERSLQQGFSRNFANQHKDLKDAAQSLGAFGVQYVKREGVYTDEERAHYAQVIAALSEWAAQAPLGDPKRGAAAIPKLAAAARKTGLTSEQALREAGMSASLRKLAPFFAEAKATLASYGLSPDQSIAGLRTELVEQEGDRASVRVHYPLGKREIDTVVSLQRLDGHWYLTDHLRHSGQALTTPAAESPEASESPPAVAPIKPE